GNKIAIGGISREFYEHVRNYYDNPENWKWQKKAEFKDGGQTRTDEDEKAMWTFEPSASLNIFQKMLDDAQIEVVYSQRLDRTKGVRLKDKRICSITMESGVTYAGKMFIDATYEGDLMAAAGVSYTYG